jgi:hypothetical protein
MKKSVVVVLTAVLVLICCFSQAMAAEKKKSSWYIGFGVGTGILEMEGETAEDYLDDQDFDNVGDELTLNFGVGAILNPKLHLGFDLSAILQELDLDNSHRSELYQVNNYFAALSYYPWKKGFFVKVGGGLSVLVYDEDTDKNNNLDTYGGAGYLVGLGYDFWLGKSFNLGIHAEYSRQAYNDKDAPDDTDFLNVYLSFYWF